MCRSPQPSWRPSPRLARVDDPSFVCVLRIKNEAEYIREVIGSALRLCERALIFDDHSTDATPRSVAPSATG